MKTKLSALLLALSLATSTFAEDHGTRGGETINVNGIPELRDLVDTTVCHWVDAEEMIKLTPELDNVLGGMAKLDWYFAAELKLELRRLSFCQTANLARIITRDPYSVHRPITVRTDQAGIRFNSDVYVDMNIFNRMSPTTRAYFLIHETMHSYIDWGQPFGTGNDNVRSMIASLRDVNEGRITTRKEFHDQMIHNHIEFPQTVTQLTPYKAQIEYLLANGPEKVQILSSVTNLEAFMARFQRINANYLYVWHRDYLRGVTHWEENLRLACETNDLDGFNVYRTLLNDESQAYGMCAQVIDLNSESALVQNVLKNFKSGEFSKNMFAKISQNKLSMKGGRLFATPALSTMTKDAASEETILITLALVKAQNDLDATLGGLSVFIVNELGQGNTQVVEDLFLTNADFENAFGINKTLLELDNLTFHYTKEKEIAQKKLPLIYQYFWDLILEKVEVEVGAPKASWLKDEINNKNLGYKI